MFVLPDVSGMNIISTIIKYPPRARARNLDEISEKPKDENGYRVFATGKRRTKSAEVRARCGWHPPMSEHEFRRLNLEWIRQQRRANGCCGTCGRKRLPDEGCKVCTERSRAYDAAHGKSRPPPSARRRAKQGQVQP